MYKESFEIDCSIIRGGTSKGIFFLENSLPPAGDLRDKIILRAFGSPDSRQIDGLGGANALTSKVCIIGPSNSPDADVDYTFGQVNIERAIVDWGGNCGNLTAAVGVFAIDKNLLKPVEPETVVRINNTNTNKMINVSYPVKDGKVVSEGEYAIAGVPGKGAKLRVEFLEPSGSITGKLLPTGNVKDEIDLGEKGKFTVSVVDAGNPVVFMKAEDLGLNGTELPEDVEKMPEVLALMEEVRSVVTEMIGMVSDRKLATIQSPSYPKIGYVTSPKEYVNPEGILIKEDEVDLVARLGATQKMHRAYMITGAVATGAASKVEGTVVNDVLSDRARNSDTLLIGQPYGPMEVITNMKDGEIEKESVYRTARKILDGKVFIPNSAIK